MQDLKVMEALKERGVTEEDMFRGAFLTFKAIQGNEKLFEKRLRKFVKEKTKRQKDKG